MAKSAKKSVPVEIPELGDLPLDPATANELDRLCSESRALAAQIKYLEDGDPEHGVVGKNQLGKRIREVVEGLGDMVPDRVLGEGWDLRRQVRTTEKIDPAKLKLALLHAGFRLKVQCFGVVQQLADLGERKARDAFAPKMEQAIGGVVGSGVRRRPMEHSTDHEGRSSRLRVEVDDELVVGRTR